MKKLLLCSLLTAASFASHASVVEIQTSQGPIKIDLFDQKTPETVANFLSYIEQGSYNQTVIHRSIDDFVMQGGGFTYTDDFEAIETQAPVINEPVLSNVKGTIAMAKLGGDADSATSQWFFNLNDNSANLDLQNGGFTVFGQVDEESFAVLESITSLTHCSVIPVVNITEEQCSDVDTVITSANLVTINGVTVLDDDPNSSALLTPVENTLIDEPVSPPETDSDSSGSVSWLLPLLLVGLRRRRVTA